MIDESDFRILDMRYKRIDDCTSEMNDARKEHTQIFIDFATL